MRRRYDRDQRRGRSHAGGGGAEFHGFEGRGVPGTWTHFGPGHGRGGGIGPGEAWRTNRDDYAGGPGSGGMRGGRYGADHRYPGPGPGGRYHRDMGARRSRGGYGGPTRGSGRGYDGKW